MRIMFAIVGTLLALATSALADRLVAVEGCDADIFVVCGLYYATWFTDFGSYGIDANDGCRGTSVPGMTEFCIDWPRSRGHFKFSHQDFKRCFVRGGTEHFWGDGCWGIECWRSEWNEVPCSWRGIPGNETEAIVTVSEIGEATASAPIETTTAEAK